MGHSDNPNLMTGWDSTNKIPIDEHAVLINSRNVGCNLAFIVENGFHTNPIDVEFLTDNNELQRLAEALVKEISDFLQLPILKRKVFYVDKRCTIINNGAPPTREIVKLRVWEDYDEYYDFYTNSWRRVVNSRRILSKNYSDLPQ